MGVLGHQPPPLNFLIVETIKKTFGTRGLLKHDYQYQFNENRTRQLPSGQGGREYTAPPPAAAEC
jgi:hypothetical protein